MRKFIAYFMVVTLPLLSPALNADGLDDFQTETATIWSPDHKAPDQSQDAQIGTSMIAWGVGLAVIIAIVFGLLKSYNNSSSSTSGTT